MAQDLIDAITARIDITPELRVLSAEEANAALDQVAKVFISDASRTWWWDAIKADVQRLAYESDQGLPLLDAIMSAVHGPVRLFVTDNQPQPWMGVAGPWDSIRVLISETWFFEFLLVDVNCAWILFDTHHNQFVIAGIHPGLQADAATERGDTE